MNERVNRSAAADANVNDKYKLTGPNRMLHELNAEQLSHWNGSISNSHTEIRETRITKRTFEYTERDVQYREKKASMKSAEMRPTMGTNETEEAEVNIRMNLRRDAREKKESAFRCNGMYIAWVLYTWQWGECARERCNPLCLLNFLLIFYGILKQMCLHTIHSTDFSVRTTSHPFHSSHSAGVSQHFLLCLRSLLALFRYHKWAMIWIEFQFGSRWNNPSLYPYWIHLSIELHSQNTKCRRSRVCAHSIHLQHTIHIAK